MTSDFARLGVPPRLIATLAERGITTPTPIQAATLPDSLAGRDLLGRGKTGSGKTYAFLLPVVARLAAERRRPAAGRPRALILAPTRELASQIEASLRPLEQAAGLTSHTVFGGVNQNPQVRALARGVDVLVACPGRLLDLMQQGHVSLDAVSITVIDEADHMADMGFLPMVRRILDRTPSGGQRMLFSATLDNAVGVVVKAYLHAPVVHEADSATAAVTTMDHHVLRVSAADRPEVIADLASAPGRTILFTRTKHGAKKLAKQLSGRGIAAVELHGNLSQNARTRNLEAFHCGDVATLVATDIAARGIHVDDVALVVHADPPTEHKAYLHRSGRTARAGQAGTVITLATPDQHGDVRTLMRAAKITPTISDVTPGHGLLQELAPGKRIVGPIPVPTQEVADRPARGSGRGASGRGGRSGGGQDRAGRDGRGATQGRPTSRRPEGGHAGAAPQARAAGGSRPAPVTSAGNRGVAAFSTAAGRSTRRGR